MRLIICSDSHSMLNKVNLPDGDFLIHCGDLLNYGNLNDLITFNHYISLIKDRYLGVYLTAGNHDRIIEEEPALCKNLLKENALLLLDEEFIIEKDGVRLKGFASPYSNRFGEWSFMYDPQDAEKQWAKIPEDTEFLITHGPPNRRLDKIPSEYVRKGEDEYVGCKQLRKRVEEINPLIHAFGHIHHSRGTAKYGKTLFVNAAICTEQYSPTNKPIVLDVFMQDGQKIVEVVKDIC